MFFLIVIAQTVFFREVIVSKKTLLKNKIYMPSISLNYIKQFNDNIYVNFKERY